MERLRRKFFLSRSKSIPTSADSKMSGSISSQTRLFSFLGVYRKYVKNDDQTYLDTKNNEIFSMTSSIDYIAEELFAIAKKSVCSCMFVKIEQIPLENLDTLVSYDSIVETS